MLQKIILQEIQLLPELAQIEVFNYLLYLKSKYVQTELIRTAVRIDKPPLPHPIFGCGSVKITMAEDFDAPLDDFKSYSY